MRLVQLSDSAFPVGAFAFSNGLETAAEEGLVCSAATLEEYVREIVCTAAFTDGIVSLHAYRSALAHSYEGLLEADRQAILCKMNAEARQMTRRMGRKLSELARRILAPERFEGWLADIRAERTPGTYPAAQGLLFAVCGLTERSLFSAQQYGTANTVLGAALRCVRVSHFDTQGILYRLAGEADTLYEEASGMDFDDMHAFSPQIDILASLHEKGIKRLFMN